MEPIQGWQVYPWEEEIDRLFTIGVQEIDGSKRKEIYGKFQQIVSEQLPIFYLVNGLSFQAIRDRLENVQFSALGGAFWNIDQLKINSEAAKNN